MVATDHADKFVAIYQQYGYKVAKPVVDASWQLKGCPKCFGSGGKLKAPCKECNGTGRVPA